MRFASVVAIWAFFSPVPSVAAGPAAGSAKMVPATTAVADPLLPSLRVRMAATERPLTFPLDDREAALHRRLTSAMVDYYPFGGTGLHLSGGALRGARPTLGLDSGWQSQSRIVTVRGHDYGYRAAGRRFAPAMTLGYTLPIARAMEVGAEAGGIVGGTTAISASPVSMLGDNVGTRRVHGGSGINAIAHLAFGYRF
jgi:hypothetical protein